MTFTVLAGIHGIGQGSEENQGAHVAGERRQMIPPTIKCTMCETSKSPEWRRGPDGKKVFATHADYDIRERQRRHGKKVNTKEKHVINQIIISAH